jgi:hypothetical protein
MGSDGLLPPGESPLDPVVKDIDPVAFALDRVRTHLVWIDEHRASFEAIRAADSEAAERELRYLADSTDQAQRHLERLIQLIMAGYTIDPAKRLPQDLARATKLVQ